MGNKVAWHGLTSLWKLIEAASQVDEHVRTYWTAIPDDTHISIAATSLGADQFRTYRKTPSQMVMLKENVSSPTSLAITCTSTSLLNRLLRGQASLSSALADGSIMIKGSAPIAQNLVNAIETSLPYVAGPDKASRLIPERPPSPVSLKRKLLWVFHLIRLKRNSA